MYLTFTRAALAAAAASFAPGADAFAFKAGGSVSKSALLDVKKMVRGYAIGTFTVTDPQFKAEYAAKIEATFEPFGGKFIVRNPVEAAKFSEGADYDLAVVVEFPDVEKALAWCKSDAYQAIVPFRKNFSKAKSFLVMEGPGAHSEHEQGKSKGYTFAELLVKDPKFKEEYVMKVDATTEAFGGSFLIRTPVERAVYREEAEYTICVLIEFPSVEKALAWNNSEVYAAISPARKKYADAISFSIYEYPPGP
jgi:uncharacterized protein (DUF1330 family)